MLSRASVEVGVRELVSELISWSTVAVPDILKDSRGRGKPAVGGSYQRTGEDTAGLEDLMCDIVSKKVKLSL
jgi:hypothetical protein